MDWLKRLLGKTAAEPSARFAHFIYVKLPEPLEPLDRGDRYEDPLDAELQLAGLGSVSGGGISLSAPDGDGRREITYCGIDVDTDDVAGARALLRDHLPVLGCKPGTQIEYVEDDVDRCDVFDGQRWTLAVLNPSARADD